MTTTSAYAFSQSLGHPGKKDRLANLLDDPEGVREAKKKIVNQIQAIRTSFSLPPDSSGGGGCQQALP
eukprot:scaffold74718_cov17-Tisochrysis_lutea.AAC.1